MAALTAGCTDRATEPAAPTTSPSGCEIPNINPETGLSTDYLNHFAEAVMVLETATTMPECLEDLRAWRPKTYAEHFADSSFAGRDAVIRAYETADPAVREALDSAARTLNDVLMQTRDAVLEHLGTPTAETLVRRGLAWLKPLIAHTAAVINGSSGDCESSESRQTAIDAMFER